MSSFSLPSFTEKLLAETLFYEENFGMVGNLSLMEEDTGRERYIASYDPEEQGFIIEKATEWEIEPGSDAESEWDYIYAVDGTISSIVGSPEEVAQKMMSLARDHDLTPHFMVLFEEEGS